MDLFSTMCLQLFLFKFKEFFEFCIILQIGALSRNKAERNWISFGHAETGRGAKKSGFET